MRYLVGIDGGNSKTLAVVAGTSGQVLGVGRTPGGNHQSAGGLDQAMRHIREAMEIALAQEAIRGDEVDMAFFTLAGADLPEDFELLLPALENLQLAKRVGLSNDTIGALRAGTDCPNAVVVILGAGTNAAGRNAEGQEIRLPGLGWMSGDWGGGGEIFRESISLVARAWDGRGRPTRLTEMVLSSLDLPDVEALISALYHRRVSGDQLHALTPKVFEVAEAGDAVARDLIVRQAEEVVTTATTLLRRLDLLARPADVVLGGSVFRAPGRLLLDTIYARMAVTAPLARVIVPEAEPVLGALFRAMDSVGVTVDEAARRRAIESYAALAPRRQEAS